MTMSKSVRVRFLYIHSVSYSYFSLFFYTLVFGCITRVAFIPMYTCRATGVSLGRKHDGWKPAGF